MKKIFKWVGIVLGSLIGLIVLALMGLYVSTGMRLNKTYTIQPEAVTIPTDAAAVERGKHWVTMQCTGCHGVDLGGTNIFNDPSLGSINAPNLTSGKGGMGVTSSDEDFVRAIRHGVDPEGQPLLIMPAKAYYYLSNGDLGDVIAYIRSVPPVDKEWGEYNLTPMARILIAAGAFGDVIGAEKIGHTGPRPSVPEPAATAEYGDYLVKISGCRTCHGKELSGGKDPNPDALLGPNLTPGGELVAWSETDFMATLRTGVTPSGHQLSSEFMPWKTLGKMSDDELMAVWLYLKSLPAKETTTK